MEEINYENLYGLNSSEGATTTVVTPTPTTATPVKQVTGATKVVDLSSILEDFQNFEKVNAKLNELLGRSEFTSAVALADMVKKSGADASALYTSIAESICYEIADKSHRATGPGDIKTEEGDEPENRLKILSRIRAYCLKNSQHAAGAGMDSYFHRSCFTLNSWDEHASPRFHLRKINKIVGLIK